MANYNPNTTHPIVKTFAEYMPKPWVDQASATVTYIGYAPLGIQSDKVGWRIERVEVVGTETRTTYAEGSMEFNYIWDNRTSYVYSR